MHVPPYNPLAYKNIFHYYHDYKLFSLFLIFLLYLYNQYTDLNLLNLIVSQFLLCIKLPSYKYFYIATLACPTLYVLFKFLIAAISA